MVLLLAACMHLAPPPAARARDLPVGAEAWPAVTDRPALTDADIARFLKANAVAEDLRRAAEERFAAELPKYETGTGNSRDPLSGIDFLRAFEAFERGRSGIEAAACSQAGVPLAEYESTYKRLLQVNDLTILDARAAATRDAIARLAESNLHTMAQEQFRFDRQRQRHDLEMEVAQLEQWRARTRRLREGQGERERARITDRLRRLPDQEQKLRDRIEKYRTVRDYERGMIDRRAGTARDSRPPEGAGTALAVDPHTRQFEEVAAAKLDRVDTEISRTEARLAQLATERHDLEAALAALPAPGTQEPTDTERDLAAQIEQLSRQMDQFHVQIDAGGSAADVDPLVKALRAQRVEQEHQLGEIEHQLDKPVMRQAQRDRAAAVRHAKELIAYGTPILIELPASMSR